MIVAQKKVLGTAAYIGRKMVMEEFCWSWGAMIQYTNEFMVKPGEIVHWDRNKKFGQAGARNYLAQNMMGEWLFMSDSDHQFDPDLLFRMRRVLEGNKLDVLSGLYLYDDSPKIPVMYQRVNGNLENIHMQPFKRDSELPLQLIKIDAAGAGCLMIRRSVFDRIDSELHEAPFAPIPPNGEDFSFFMRLEKLGIQAYCCPNIESKHLGISAIGLDDCESDLAVVPGVKVVAAQQGILAK